MDAVRVQKFIAQAGLASRRRAEAWILQGRVTVNGRVVQALGTRIDPSRDEVRVDGRLVRDRGKRVYLLLNKPGRCLTTVRDPKGRKTVMDYVPSNCPRVFPVGRLDWDATGALILTNDGEMAQRLTHPRYGVPKIYRVKVRGHPSHRDRLRLQRGVMLDEGMTAPAEVRCVKKLPRATWLEITLHQGWYRQIKRMGEAIGHPVIKIHRVAYGPVKLGSLPSGSIRRLTEVELKALKMATIM